MKNLFLTLVVSILTFSSFSQYTEELIFEDSVANLSLKKFTYSEFNSKYIFFFFNDSDSLRGKEMSICFDSSLEVESFFYTLNRVIDQQKYTKYKFSNQSVNMRWATKNNVGLVEFGKQYCYVSKKNISDIIQQLR